MSFAAIFEHTSLRHFVEAWIVARSTKVHLRGTICIFHFEPVSLNAASDSASCLHTASTVNREIGMPNVDLVCGEMKRTIDSIVSGISFKTPTNFPPPATTIEDISVSLKGRRAVFLVSCLGAPTARP